MPLQSPNGNRSRTIGQRHSRPSPTSSLQIQKTPDAKTAPIRRATLEPGVWDWGFLPFMLVFRHGTGRYGPSSMVWRRSSGGRLGDVDLLGNSPAGAAQRVRV